MGKQTIITLMVIITVIVASVIWVNRNEPVAYDYIEGGDITKLLTGNTAIGVWNNDEYRQSFAADGVSIYAPKGKRSTRGKWRVSQSGTHYESWWNGGDDNWEAWQVARIGEQLIWIDHRGREFPFEMLPGQQLIWE